MCEPCKSKHSSSGKSRCPFSGCGGSYPVFGTAGAPVPRTAQCVRPANYGLLNAISAFDQSVLTRYIPDRPAGLDPNIFGPQFEPGQTYPWYSNTIPSEIVPLPLPPGPIPGSTSIPNQDEYDKFQSVPYSIGFYQGMDMRNTAPTDPKLSIFLTNLRDRGPDNYKKKVYMTALNAGNMIKYKEKIDNFINRFFNDITNYVNPVLSTFQDLLITDFFLPMHVGYDIYPDEVIQYFKLFVNRITRGDPDEPERNAEFMFGYQHVDCVKEYFRKRNNIIIESNDDTTFLYWWNIAGMNSENLVMEAIHNIIAFNQFTNCIYLLILDKLTGTPVPFPPGAIIYNFIQEFINAIGNPDEQLNVVREFYRLTTPNGASFSRIVQATPNVPPVTIQGRHLHKPIMVVNQAIASGGNPLAYFTYDTAKYAAFNTNFDTTTCPIFPPGPANNYNPEDHFTDSPVDNETVLDLCNTQMFPVYPLPIYAPFGLGYRRCAGETLAYLVTVKLIDKIKYLNFEFRTPATDYKQIGVAPFTLVRDNIFVIP